MLAFFGFSCLFGATELDELYRYAFSRDMGYTLIGEKPVSLEGISYLEFPFEPEVLDDFISSLKNAFNGSEKFVCKVFKSYDGYEIELIHRNALRALVTKNLTIKWFIEERFSREADFFAEIEDKNVSIFSFDPYIRGLLFGYGEENSDYFCRMGLVSEYLQKPPSVTYFHRDVNLVTIVHNPFLPICYLPYVIKKPQLRPGFDSLESEWEWLNAIERSSFGYNRINTSEAVPPYFIDFPTYVDRSGGESDEIRAKYVRARTKLAEIFCGKSYQQAVVEEISKKRD
jgi:hypothetical protein